MTELTDRPTTWRGCGHESDIWHRGRKLDPHSREGRAVVAAASRLVFHPHPDGSASLDETERVLLGPHTPAASPSDEDPRA